MSATPEIVRSQMSALEAEVARLREELVLERQVHSATAAALNAERATHEATLADRDLFMVARDAEHARAEAAETRVAELGRDKETLRKLAREEKGRFDAALDWARGLLEELYKIAPTIPSVSWGERYQNWLRAHPAAKGSR